MMAMTHVAKVTVGHVPQTGTMKDKVRIERSTTWHHPQQQRCRVTEMADKYRTPTLMLRKPKPTAKRENSLQIKYKPFTLVTSCPSLEESDKHLVLNGVRHLSGVSYQ